MAIKGPMSNLPLVKRNTFRLIIRAVTLAAGLSRLVVRGSGWDRGNGIRGEDGVQPLSPLVTCERCRLFPCARSLPRQLTVSTTSPGAVFSYLLKILHHLKPFPLCDFQWCYSSSWKRRKATEQITHRWWITISTVLSCFNRHFKVRNSNLISGFVLWDFHCSDSLWVSRLELKWFLEWLHFV